MFRECWSKFKSAFCRKDSIENELDEEMRVHLELLREDHLSQGLAPDEAGERARRQFGNRTAVYERAREAWRFSAVDAILDDLRSGLRSIRQAPGFSLLLILTLALGIGANTAIFSVVHAVLLSPPPFPDGERLVYLHETTSGQGIPVSWLNFQHWKNSNHTFESLAGFETADLTLVGRGEPKLTRAGVVSATFFRLTGWRPMLGRLLSAQDDEPNAAPAVLVTGEFWAGVLGNDSHIVGKTLNLDGKAYQVVGVLPPGLKFFLEPVDFFIALDPREGHTVNRADHTSIGVLGLLKPGITLSAARDDLNGILRRLALFEGGVERDHLAAISWQAEFGTAEIRPLLLVLMGAVALILLIACANVASLLLVRSTTRAREFAIRSAMGAGRARVTQQLLTETLVIAVLGAVVGLLLARVCLQALVRAGPQDIPRLWEAGLNAPVLLFTTVLAGATALLAGLAPVLNLRKAELTDTLKEDSPTSGRGRRGQALRSGLVIAEIAITVVLSFGCALLLRSLAFAETADPGFHAAGVLALELQLPSSRYTTDDSIRQFYARLVHRLRREPGVTSMGVVNCPPSTGGCAKGWYSFADVAPPPRSAVPLTILTKADPSYFETLGIRLLAGRGFTDADRVDQEPVVLVNERLARHWWPKEPRRAVGQVLKVGGPYMEGPSYLVVGVVSDVRQAGLDSEPFAEVYMPFAQAVSPSMVVMIRGPGTYAAPFIATVRRIVAEIDRDLPIQSLRPFEQWMGKTLERRRFGTLLLAVFAMLAMMLSCVGIAGVLNYWVGVRQNEIAIRIALGAQRRAILGWVAWNASRSVSAGLILGLLGCWGAGHGIGSLLFGVSPQDPQLLFGAFVVVILMAASAASFPLRRALTVDPIRNLRDS